MDIVWSRFLKSLYRKQPLVSFIVTIGVVDAAIGGFSEHWSLLAVGLGTVGTAITLRWWMLQRGQEQEYANRAPVYYLPSQSDRPSLPPLKLSKKQPPRR